MGLKQKAVLAILGMVALYALAIGCWFFCQQSAWTKSEKAYRSAKARFEDECELIKNKNKLKEEYESEKSQMPTFGRDKTTGATWMALVSELAKKHYITLGQRNTGDEIEAGDVYEVELDVKGFEGCLESLVKFMHELENTTEGMFDIKSLSLKPSNKRGYLKGQFTLTCAFMREDASNE